ncbi:MAG TPA: hypothetical protein VIJ25_15060, partial [Methylococcales bacterium]
SATPQHPKSNLRLWNHFMCVVGAGMPLGYKRIKVLNSWGVEVGEKGIQYFTADYVNSGYVRDAFTFYKPTPVPVVQPTAQIKYWEQFWSNVKAWFANKPLPYPSVPIGSFMWWYKQS